MPQLIEENAGEGRLGGVGVRKSDPDFPRLLLFTARKGKSNNGIHAERSIELQNYSLPNREVAAIRYITTTRQHNNSTPTPITSSAYIAATPETAAPLLAEVDPKKTAVMNNLVDVKCNCGKRQKQTYV